MQKKIIRRNLEISEKFSSPDLHPLLHRIYSVRGITSAAELECGLERLLPYHDLLGIDKAVLCLADILSRQEKILIVGDFDADGATSTALAVRALKSFGAEQVEFLVPNRFTYGYGLTPELVNAAKDFSPAVIVTVDNGIANNAGVAAAKALGIKVVVTDHHLPGLTLPDADVIVNPNQPGDTFASKHIAGVGVIFYVMLALRRHLADIGWFAEKNIPEPNMSRLLDLVALGTVADVVALDHNNRVLVQQGLRRIRAGQCVPGISALLEIANRNQARLVASDLGFAVGPRLNAAGRLDDMSFGIACLLTDDATEAMKMAMTLNQLNDERRQIEQEMQEQAFDILNKIKPDKETELPKGVCLFDPQWHQGVIGILASRIKDRFHRPVIAFALSNENEIKGSARSVPGLHIRDVLAQISAQYPHLIDKFGGHAMAAGLSMPRSAFKEFSQRFNEVVSQHITDEQLNNFLMSDGELQNNELNLEIAEVLRAAGPWGQAFPEPMFDGVFELIDQRLVGNKHLKMVLSSHAQTIDAIAFNIDIEQWPNHRCKQVHVAYRLDVNEFRGRRSVQLIVENLEEA
ncbi:MAG: single-stranded-DNA-specific exonuclease RecJ [Gammaproteobacteria bacterium]|nr:single-stranded-DNA-specific exonuclease RecJ [Gammaproteobacteria bacterium]